MSAQATGTLPEEMSKYTYVRMVGKGSFGAAHLVTTQAGEPLIAKEMHIGKMSSAERESVDSEVKILSALKHPNIIRYEECVQSGMSLYIIMEYADGGDLYQRISALQSPMSEENVLYLFAQICLAVKHLHSRRILHRDLKSQNVFLTKDNVVKLGDFGLATALRHTYQQAKTLCGTPNYFSPELVEGRPFTNKSDIWAMGCIMYELVTQRFAFSGTSIPDIMQRIVTEQPAPVPQHYSEGLRAILSRMLCKEQAIRPSIDQLMRAYVLRDALLRIQKTLLEGTGVAAAAAAAAAAAGSGTPPTAPAQARMGSGGAGGGGGCGGGGRHVHEHAHHGRGGDGAHHGASDDAAVKSPQHPYVKDEELAELEKAILSDQLSLNNGKEGGAQALLEELMNVNDSLEITEDDGGAEFGDDLAIDGLYTMAAATPPEGEPLGARRDSLGGEIEGLLAEFEMH
eukprot:Rhum_TRINITY_DN14637_c0_g1::Rhum_TRINITY_DN14637_c0_g1_i1::g.102599::m.102599/K08857/NEK1_4_5; NIMA (never in mitosis gene a)-related kinase 1/4/5